MMRAMVLGGVTGGLGTLALNATTYADVALRGRAPSDLPARVVGRSADDLGLSLGADPQAAHRRTGLGALFGYVTGMGLGAVYGLVRSRVHIGSVPLAGVALGSAAMVGANVPAVARGLTDPRRWGLAGWLADLVPHAAYGLVTAAAFERAAGPDPS